MIASMDSIIQAHAPTPTHQEVCDFALTLALDAGVENRANLDLLHWPENTPPPAGELYAYEWATKFREKTRTALTERMNPGERETLYNCFDPSFAAKRVRKVRKHRYPPAPTPTFAEVAEFARVLAMDAGDVNRNLLRLIGWTSGEHLKMTGKTFAKYLPPAQAYWNMAWELLTERMALDHRWRLRRLHREKLRRRQKAYRWTRRPLSRPEDAAPSRRRGLPLWRAARAHTAPRSHSPPGRILPVSSSVTRSDECRLEELLCCTGGGHRPGALRQRSPWNPLHKCDTRFIDNRIAFLYPLSGETNWMNPAMVEAPATTHIIRTGSVIPAPLCGLICDRIKSKCK